MPGCGLEVAVIIRMGRALSIAIGVAARCAYTVMVGSKAIIIDLLALTSLLGVILVTTLASDVLGSETACRWVL